MARVHVVDGHPDAASLTAALATAYVEGARDAGHAVRWLVLREARFDPVLRGGYHGEAQRDPVVLAMQDDLVWCEHLVIVTPNWWWSAPALLKGWIDRAFVPGKAMRYHERFPYVEKLMRGRSARIVYTENAPWLLAHTARRDLLFRWLDLAVLKHCGFAPVRRTELGPVGEVGEATRRSWIERVRELGRRAT